MSLRVADRLAQEEISIRLDLAFNSFQLRVDLSLPGKGVTALFGHSGSGKTTLLRCLAGLERMPRAQIVVNGVCWQDETRFVPTAKRGLGYVFQEPSLFPHLSVRKNLAFGQRAHLWCRNRHIQMDEALEHTAQRLGLLHLLGRTPDKLSGGERQRVAIARALLSQPQILLLDEPLAALDVRSKQEILPYLERLREELGIPMIYVSHSPDEVARLADHLVLMRAGEVMAHGPLPQILSRTDLSEFFADETGVVLDARVTHYDEVDHLSRLDFQGGQLFVSQRSHQIGQRIRCRILARDVSLSLMRQDMSSILNRVQATVVDINAAAKQGDVLIRLVAQQTVLLARVTRRSCRDLALKEGMTVWAQIKAVAVLD